MEIIDFTTRNIKVSEQNPSRSKQSVLKTEFSTPNLALVEALRELLALAESGELQSLISTGLMYDGNIIDGWYADPDKSNPFTLVGAMEALKQDFILASIESRC